MAVCSNQTSQQQGLFENKVYLESEVCTQLKAIVTYIFQHHDCNLNCITLWPLSGTEIHLLTSDACLQNLCIGLGNLMLVDLFSWVDENESTFKLQNKDFSVNFNNTI